jgi:threonine synthase
MGFGIGWVWSELQLTMPVLFHSTNGQAPPVNLREALLTGQAPDRGLYLPREFPRLATDEIAAFAQLPYHAIACRVLAPYTEGILPLADLAALCTDAYNFAVPLEPVRGCERVAILRLDRGPTASFKDFAARLMGRLIGRFVRERGQMLTILTATSGDTGSAVAHAFHGVAGIQVVVLFPLAEVSVRQRKLMTTLTGNVRCVALDGKFDDCQALVKQAFADPALKHLPLSSANSINIGRLLPQSVYYFYAASRLALPGEPIVFAVPSGNFGDMMGAVVARQMGLPLRKLVVPVNGNDEFPRFLATGAYARLEPSLNCLSNAMNVGHPSNLARLVAIYSGQMDERGIVQRAPDFAALRRDLFSSSVSDAATLATMRAAWDGHQLLLEPHGAVGWRGLLDYLAQAPLAGAPAVVLETAHPAKFPEAIEQTLGFSPEVPPALAAAEQAAEDYDQLVVSYPAFRDYLLRRS